MEFKHVTVV